MYAHTHTHTAVRTSPVELIHFALNWFDQAHCEDRGHFGSVKLINRAQSNDNTSDYILLHTLPNSCSDIITPSVTAEVYNPLKTDPQGRLY